MNRGRTEEGMISLTQIVFSKVLNLHQKLCGLDDCINSLIWKTPMCRLPEDFDFRPGKSFVSNSYFQIGRLADDGGVGRVFHD